MTEPPEQTKKEKPESEWQSPAVVQEQDRDSFDRVLLEYPPAERDAWRAEALRLARIVSEYARIKPKRHRDPKTGKYEFTSEVRQLCEQVQCTEAGILLREPHRARSISPHTLDDWLRDWRRRGLTAFLRQPPGPSDPQQDHRCATMSAGAIGYVNENWRRFRNSARSPIAPPQSTVYRLSRLDRRPLKAVSGSQSIEIDEPAEYADAPAIFNNAPALKVNEFDEEE